MADSISDTGNTARSVTNAADSSVSFSGQGVAPQKSENEHRQPSVEKDAALSTCQARLDPDGSKAGLLDNISERSSPVSSEKMTAEQRQQHFEEVEQHLDELLSLLEPVFNASEVERVQEFIDYGEYGVALEALVDIVNESSKTISQKVFSLIKEAVVMMEMDMDMADAESRLAGRVSDE